MGCCTSTHTDAPQADMFSAPRAGTVRELQASGYFIHTDPALEDSVVIEFDLRAFSQQRNVLEAPIVRASKRRTPRSAELPQGLSACSEPESPHTASTAYNKGQRRVLGSGTESRHGWGSSINMSSTRGSVENESLDTNFEVEAELARLDAEVTCLRGPESVGDLASEPDRSAVVKKCRRIVKRAMESQGINDDPDQFDPCPEPLTVIAASIRRARRWVHSLPSYPLQFPPTLSSSGGSAHDFGSGLALLSQLDTTFSPSATADASEFTEVAPRARSHGADRDIKPRVEPSSGSGNSATLAQ